MLPVSSDTLEMVSSREKWRVRLSDLFTAFDAALEWETDDPLLVEESPDQPPASWATAAD